MTAAREIDFRYAPASRWTLICRLDDPHKSLVREDGALLYGFQLTMKRGGLEGPPSKNILPNP